MSYAHEGMEAVTDDNAELTTGRDAEDRHAGPDAEGRPAGAGKPVIYISGPMTGKDKLNEPAFRAAAAYAEALGYRAIVPHDLAAAEHHGPCPKGYEAAEGDHSGWCHLRADVAVMASCDAVLLLLGWTSSKGAQIEFEIARKLEMPCFKLEQLLAASELFTAAPAAETDEPDPLEPGTDVTDRLSEFPRVWIKDRDGNIYKPHGRDRLTRWRWHRWGFEGNWSYNDLEGLAPITVATEDDLDAAGIPAEDQP